MERDASFVKVARADDLANGQSKIVFLGIKRLALFRIDDVFYCIQNNCPHAGGFLGNGTIDGCGVRCPRHDWWFDLKNGQCRTDPRYEVQTYVTRVEDGDVYIDTATSGGIV
ncbi:MAG: nitrite reductase small subunit NirD [Bradymonadaceae bacterium]|nr:nitrite reductase small subunit NirD [Lujinxingiaceae bacterium]